MSGLIFSEQELERYKRQLQIPEFGIRTQAKLMSSHVLLLGAGGVGCPVAIYLAAAGVGRITVLDGDVVEASNLNRQILFKEVDVGLPKAVLLQERLLELNPHVEVRGIFQWVTREGLLEFLKGVDLVLDTFDKNVDRLMVNAVTVGAGIPSIHAFSKEFCSEMVGVMPYETPCLGCVMDEGFLEEKEVPVLGVTAGLTGIMMASFAIKHLTRLGRVIWGKRLIWDLYLEGFIEVELTKDPNCPVCPS